MAWEGVPVALAHDQGDLDWRQKKNCFACYKGKAVVTSWAMRSIGLYKGQSTGGC